MAQLRAIIRVMSERVFVSNGDGTWTTWDSDKLNPQMAVICREDDPDCNKILAELYGVTIELPPVQHAQPPTGQGGQANGSQPQ